MNDALVVSRQLVAVGGGFAGLLIYEAQAVAELHLCRSPAVAHAGVEAGIEPAGYGNTTAGCKRRSLSAAYSILGPRISVPVQNQPVAKGAVVAGDIA